MPEVEAPRKINVGLVVGGGAVIAVSAAAIYYVYSKNQLIDEYLKLVASYDEEYQRYMADGVIDETEQKKLKDKGDRLSFLEELIRSKGWIVDLLEALAKLGIVAIIYKVTPKVIDYISRRYPPPGSTVCPKCNKDLHSLWRLKRHLEREHKTKPIDTPEARDAWDAINQLPQWLLDVIAVVSGLGDTFWEYVGKPVTEISPEIWLVIVLAVLACILIIVFFPAVIPIVAAAVVL